MPDNDFSARPATGADLDTPPAGAGFRPAEPLKDAGVAFDPATSGGSSDDGTSGRLSEAKQLVREGTAKVQGQAADKARAYAEQGKAKAGDALGQLSKMLDDAAGQVDEKLGAQYGHYARQAAGQVSSFADAVAAKDVDQLVDDVRAFVSRSPAAALGIAAALGFAVARVVQAGIDDRG